MFSAKGRKVIASNYLSASIYLFGVVAKLHNILYFEKTVAIALGR